MKPEATAKLWETLRAHGPEEDEFFFQQYLGLHGWWNIAGGRSSYNIAKDPRLAGDCVEIGSFKGLSTLFTALGAKKLGIKVFSIDPHPQSVADEFNRGERTYKALVENIHKFGFDDTIIPIIGKSEDVVKHWTGPIKYLLIDGEHTYEAVLKDQAWLQFVVPGGLALFDDSGPESGVKRAMSEIIDKSPDWEFSEHIYVKKGNFWWMNG